MNTLAHRRRSTMAVLLVALVVLAACTAETTPSPSPSTPAAPSAPASPQPSHEPAPSDQPAVGYAAASVPESENASGALTIVPGGDGLIAIGFDGAFGTTLWTSPDGGSTWTDITPDGFEAVGIASVVEFNGGLIGVGRGNTIDVDTQLAAVYRSDDGVTWRQVEGGEEMLGQLIDVVATDDGLFAVGGVPGADSAGIWRSTDGENWERTGGDFESAFMWSIAEGGPGLVAVGWRRNPEPSAAVWTSADGVEWTLASDPEGFELTEGTDVIDLDGTLVMVGGTFDGSGRIWTSTDGATWDLVDLDMAGGFARTLTSTPAGLLAVGSGGDMAGAAWLSTDGRSWEPFGELLPGAYFQSAHVTDDGLLMAGATQAGTLETGVQAHAMIWTATLDD
jgi:hypothetical protein